MSKVYWMFFLLLGMVLIATPSFAAEGNAADASGLIGLGAGLGIGIAALGAGIEMSSHQRRP